jgi:hypothetical protein
MTSVPRVLARRQVARADVQEVSRSLMAARRSGNLSRGSPGMLRLPVVFSAALGVGEYQVQGGRGGFAG